MHLNTFVPPPDKAPIDIYYDAHKEWLNDVYAAAPHAKEAPFVIEYYQKAV